MGCSSMFEKKETSQKRDNTGKNPEETAKINNNVDDQKEAQTKNDNTSKNQKETEKKEKSVPSQKAKNPKEVEYDKIVNYEYQSVPNFKYELDIKDTENNGGINCFEVYISFKDNKAYIASISTVRVNIFSITDNKKVHSFVQEKAHITMIKYYLNRKNYKEYLVTGDGKGFIFIYDINDNYNITFSFELVPDANCLVPIYGCMLIFPQNSEENYLVGSANTGNSIPDFNSVTAIFSAETGNSIRVINNSKKEGVYNIMEWHNKKNKKYYIIQFTSKKILINNLLEEELYCTFVNDKKYTFPFPLPNDYHCGVLYDKGDTEYLFSSCFNGDISVHDLYNKSLVRTIENAPYCGSTVNMMVKWNNKYIIANDFIKNTFKVVDIEQNKFISDITDEHIKIVMVIQKIKHPTYGEALISSGDDKIIKLWTIKK